MFSPQFSNNNVEWVELYNVEASTVEISGWASEGAEGGTAGLPGGTNIDAGQAVVLILSVSIEQLAKAVEWSARLR